MQQKAVSAVPGPETSLLDQRRGDFKLWFTVELTWLPYKPHPEFHDSRKDFLQGQGSQVLLTATVPGECG